MSSVDISRGQDGGGDDNDNDNDVWPPRPFASEQPLTLPEYQRYGRQLVLPAFGGVPSQLKLRHSKVLVVGAGGLGCPAVQYLASAGVGHITVVDHDVVERSNLGRQVLHTEARIGTSKAESIRAAGQLINPHAHVEPVCEPFTATNALVLVQSHDLVLDCTDNPLTRYLISDAAVLADKMVVSGAAQGIEGQLMVLHKHLIQDHLSDTSVSASRGPCYRCLFPVAPRPEDVTDCEDGGVLGTTTGLIGTLQANEAIKLLTGMGLAEEAEEARSAAAAAAARPGKAVSAVPAVRMLLASPMSTTPFRSIKLRPRARNCRICGEDDLLQEQGVSRITDLATEDYHSFCGVAAAKDGVGAQSDSSFASMTVSDLAAKDAKGAGPTLILDVRTEEEVGIVKLPRTLSEYESQRRTMREDLQFC